MLTTIRLLATAVITLLSVEAAAQEVPTDESGFTEFVAQVIRREVGNAPVSVKSPGGAAKNLDWFMPRFRDSPGIQAG